MTETLADYQGVTLFVTHNMEEAYRICICWYWSMVEPFIMLANTIFSSVLPLWVLPKSPGAKTFPTLFFSHRNKWKQLIGVVLAIALQNEIVPRESNSLTYEQYQEKLRKIQAVLEK